MQARSAKLTILVAAALALLGTSPLGAGEKLTMRVSPRMAFAPATLVIDAVAERDPANRALTIQMDSGGYYRSSVVELEGADAPRTTTVRYSSVPAGTYDVKIVLLGADGHPRAEAVREVMVFDAAEDR